MATELRRKIPYVRLGAQLASERAEIEAAFERVFSAGDFVGGEAIAAFEREAAAYCGTKYAVAVASGTDALILGLKALGIGPGDEVITPPNSFVASTACIVHVGATPVFADVLDDQNIDPAKVEAAITPRTRAIMVVHLTGRVCAMDEIAEIAARHGVKVIEDAAQAIGSAYRGRRSGALGDLGCFSAHPLKNLNAAGDAGFVTTDDAAVAERIARLRNHGLADRNTVLEWGYVSRMDTFQAEILRLRLKGLPEVIERRRRNAALYRELIDPRHVFMPPCRQHEYNTFHTFVVQVDRRDELQKYLADRGIGTAIHYPKPIHLQPAAASLAHKPGDFPATERQAGRILTLPVHQFLDEEDLRTVAGEVNRFFGA